VFPPLLSFPRSFVSFMMQLPSEPRTTVGAMRLSSSATLFVPRWCSIAQSPPSMSNVGSLADEGNGNLLNSVPDKPVNLHAQSMPVNVAMQATESTPSQCTDQNQSEVEIEEEETRDAAIRDWVKNEFVMHSGMAGGLRNRELHDTEARTWPVSAFDVDDGLQPPPMSTYGDSTPSFYDSPRCRSDDSMVFNASSQEPEFHGPGDRNLPTVSLASVDSLGQSGQHTQAAAASAPRSSPSLVLVQVPVQLQCGANTLLGHEPLKANVTMLSQETDATTGAVSLEMRVVLSPSGMSPEGPSSTCKPHLPRQLRHSAKSTALPQARHGLGAISAKKRDLVCCHWKAKGWCKYEDSCKFMHLKKKRGVGHCADDGDRRQHWYR